MFDDEHFYPFIKVVTLEIYNHHRKHTTLVASDEKKTAQKPLFVAERCIKHLPSALPQNGSLALCIYDRGPEGSTLNRQQ